MSDRALLLRGKGPLVIEWRCPRCGSAYTCSGECGQNVPFVCRERTRPALVASDEALERARAAYDAVYDAGGGSADDGELLAAVVAGLFEDCDTFDTLVTIAEAILETHYPTAIFSGRFDQDSDPGVQLVGALRSVAAAIPENQNQCRPGR